jgi:hypothetical protein
MRHIAGDMFIFQQDSAPAHRARETIEYLSRNAPYFIGPEIWPPNSPDLNPVDYSIWSIMEQRVYQRRIQNTDELRQCLVSVWNNILLTLQLISGDVAWQKVYVKKEVILNTNFKQIKALKNCLHLISKNAALIDSHVFF